MSIYSLIRQQKTDEYTSLKEECLEHRRLAKLNFNFSYSILNNTKPIIISLLGLFAAATPVIGYNNALATTAIAAGAVSLAALCFNRAKSNHEKRADELEDRSYAILREIPQEPVSEDEYSDSEEISGRIETGEINNEALIGGGDEPVEGDDDVDEGDHSDAPIPMGDE